MPPTAFSEAELRGNSTNTHADGPTTIKSKGDMSQKKCISSWEDYPLERGEYSEDPCPDCPPFTAFLGQINYYIMITISLFAEFLRDLGFFKIACAVERPEQRSFPKLGTWFEKAFVNNIYRMATDVVNRPIAGVPSAIMRLKDRVSHDYNWTYEFTGTETDVINMGSYNYLGFSHNDGPCAEYAASLIDKHGVATCSTPKHRISNNLQNRLEKEIASFLGVEEAICFPMGFGTNSMNISALVNKGCLILSDELNHASLVLGMRLSKADVVIFKHNDAVDLEKKLRNAFIRGFQKNQKHYSKILIVVEGIYSMEGTITNLPAMIEVKKKYNAYLFLDEAHSIGAIGPNGRGVVDYWGCNPRDVDILMGTLTKSFAAAGGYIGGSRALIEHLRRNSAGTCYGVTMAPPVIGQVSASLRMLQGHDGTKIGKEKITHLLRNTRYFRKRLRQLGFLIYGHEDSPVVPLMVFYISRVVCVGREALKRGIGVVSVGYPAAPLTKARTRFCISADHTKEQLDKALEIIDEVGDVTGTKYGKNPYKPGTIIEY